MKVHKRSTVALLLAVSISACSGSDICPLTASCFALRSTARGLAGSWTEVEAWRGDRLTFMLSARDTSLVGSAAYEDTTSKTGGTGTVSGYVFWQGDVNTPGGVMPAQPVVVLNLAFDDGTTAHFDQGRFSMPDHLQGVLTFSADTEAVSYVTDFARPPYLNPPSPATFEASPGH
jgi:hypothetical protein